MTTANLKKQRREWLESQPALTSEERSELATYQQGPDDDEVEDDEGEVLAQTSFRSRKRTKDRVSSYAKRKNLSEAQAWQELALAALAQSDSGTRSKSDADDDLRRLCLLDELYRRAENDDVKRAIAERMKRSFGIDLGDSDDDEDDGSNGGSTRSARNGSNANRRSNGRRLTDAEKREMRKDFDEYRRSGGTQIKEFDDWLALSDKDREKKKAKAKEADESIIVLEEF